MISNPTQDTRRLAVFTCLGKDVLLLRRFAGQEQMSGLFEFRLEMLSTSDGLDPRKIVGTNVTFVVRGAEGEPRYFNGLVSQFSQVHTEWFVPTYTATVVPWLWFLTQTADCRIFQNRSTPQIVEQVFGELGFRDFSFAELRESYPPREYCVQYRETDFAFVSRLLEEEGIAYRFQHADGRHTMICSDSNMLMQDLPEANVDFADPQATGDLADQVTQWNHAMQFRSGRWSQTDYDFQLPVKDLMVSERTTMKTAGAVDWEVYEYPGRYVDKGYGSQLTRVRMQQQEAEHDLAEGSSTYRTITPGGRFRFRSHRSPAETGRQYLTTSVSHRATVGDTYFTRAGHEPEGFSYENQFQCIPSAVTYRPPLVTKRPVVEGPQTAVVVGPPGEEIYPDEFGRVKVQFHWDREGNRDDKSSCWMRVSQVHAGQGWGNIDLPRIGEEVIVSFLEGDPDRPIIKGRVYNAHVMPPFGLPAAKTRSGGKTNTHKGSGYNEMTMDDTAGQEQIRVNAQKDMDTTIGNNQTLGVGVDRTSDIGNNDSLTVGVDKSGEIGNDAAVTVGNNTTYDVANDIVINAGTSITLQCGASKIHMNQAGVITISGVFVTSAAAATQSILAPITTITGTSVLNQLGAVCFQLGGIAHIKAGKTTVTGANVEVKGKAQTVIRGAPIAIGEAGAPLVLPIAPPAKPGAGGPAAPAGPASTASAAEGQAVGGAGAAGQAAGAAAQAAGAAGQAASAGVAASTLTGDSAAGAGGDAANTSETGEDTDPTDPADGRPADSQSGTDAASSSSAEERAIESITMKRKHIDIDGDDKYGHWWLEIGDPADPDSESYGWWPTGGVGPVDTLLGTSGDLNGQTGFGGTASRDPHHGDSADETFHPTVPAGDTRSEAEIQDCLRDFAQGYSGEWRWTFGYGQNCHTFQEAAMEACGLGGP